VFFIGSIGLLLLTYIPKFAVYINGAPRAVNLFGFSFHYAELIKLSVILYIAKIIEENNLDTFKKYLLRILLPVGVVCILLIQRKCTSSALLIGFIAFCVLFVAKIRAAYLWKTALIALCALIAIISLVYVTHDTKWEIFPRVHTMVEERVKPFFGKIFNSDMTATVSATRNKDEDFQSQQSRIAVASGGIIPKGPGNSTQRYILPNAYDDYVFAIIVEEYGIIGAFLVLLIYLNLFFRVVVIARSCTRQFSMIAVLGLMMIIVFQAMLHIAVTVGIVPPTGQTLPFVSLGGSSLIVTGIAFGIILSISRAVEERNMPNTIAEEAKNVAVATNS
jgi:cell division protein FtsW